MNLDSHSEKDLPVVASYIVTFLKPEMLHVYRQVAGLTAWRQMVFCQKRENEKRFPLERLKVIPKPATHQLRRFWQKNILRQPVQIYRSEAQKLEQELQRSGAQLLHVYFGHIGVHLLPLLEITRLPVVVSFHGADAQVNSEKPKYLAATRRMFALVRLVFARSESIADRLVAMGCPREKIRIQRTGIPLAKLPFHPRTPPEDGAWKCLQAGRLIPKKGYFTSLQAFAAFSKSYPKATFTIAGEGALFDELNQCAMDLGIRDKVQFAGFLSEEELHALYLHHHLFLHPSETATNGDQEGVPNALLEAMASGLPVLATRHGGIPEAVENSVHGILMDEKDPQGLAKAMLALAASPAEYHRLSEAGSRRVKEMFDLQQTIHVLEGYYSEAVVQEHHP